MREGALKNGGLSSDEHSDLGVCTTSAAFAAALLIGALLSGCSTMVTDSQVTGSETVSGQAAEDEFHRPLSNGSDKASAEQREDADALCSASGILGAGTSKSSDHDGQLIWDRLRDGFSLSIPDDPRVEREWEWFVSHPGFLERVQDRASLYMHFILDELNKRNMPSELALLPVVESGYQPFAYSPGRAAGIWQFIPSTAHDMGLKQNWWYDGRKDVVAGTRAALDYLEQLNQQFDGDWALTLAAYNAGAGNVAKAIERNQRLGRPTDFWSLDLPAETETYVPRLFGVAKLFQDPEAAGLTLKPIPDKPYFTEVHVGGQIDLSIAAQLAGLSLDKLHQLNPGCNRWATDPEGPYELLIPVEHRDRFEHALAELDPDKRVKIDHYKVRHGDNLRAIARRYRTPVAVLRSMNELSGSRVPPGHELAIPIASHADIAYRQEHSDATAAATQPSSKPARPAAYVVRAGDTLWGIAQTTGVSVHDLTAWNHISRKTLLRPGHKLTLSGAPQTASVSEAHTGNERPTLRYSVRKGDSLYTIAQHFNVTVQDLRRWNRLSGNALQPGQKLKVYLEVSEQ